MSPARANQFSVTDEYCNTSTPRSSTGASTYRLSQLAEIRAGHRLLSLALICESRLF